MTELNPCPCLACKSSNILVGDALNTANELYGYVLCLGCGLRMEAFMGNWEDARKLAVKKWNLRASPWIIIEGPWQSESDLPPISEEVLVKYKCQNGAITNRLAQRIIGTVFGEKGKDYPLTKFGCVLAWMPIPPLQEDE